MGKACSARSRVYAARVYCLSSATVSTYREGLQFRVESVLRSIVLQDLFFYGCRRSVVRGVFAEEGVRGAFKYLAEAASAIFKPGTSDVDWSGSGSGWSGSITHHEEAQRLRQLYKIVQASREQITGFFRTFWQDISVTTLML